MSRVTNPKRAQSGLIRASRTFSVIIDQTADYVALTTKGEIRDHLQKLNSTSEKCKTQETSFVNYPSYRDNVRRHLEEVTHAAFNQSKLASLRRSPACIVWPERPPPPPEPKPDADDSCTSEVAKKDSSVEPKRLVSVLKIKSTKKKSAQRLNRRVFPDEDGDDDTDEDSDSEIRVEKFHSNSSFWNYSRGNVRIDSVYLGAPRRDPYNSAWTRDARRCFFTSGFVPHHRRLYNPLLVKRNSPQQEKTRGGNVTNTNNNDDDNDKDNKRDNGVGNGATIRVCHENRQEGDKEIEAGEGLKKKR